MIEQRLRDHAILTDAYLASEIDETSGVPERLSAAMRYALLGGGKRFRPFLVIESAAVFGVPVQSALPTAAALECLHCYSLVHDDLPAMDNDKVRRGQPSVWAQFDDWTAILAGDALLTLAFEILACPKTHSDPGVRNALVSSLAVAAGRFGMVGGQMLDLNADKLGEPKDPTLEHIRHLQSMKTGALIRFACEAGALLGGASDSDRGALTSYGSHLGVVFQIADDLLDAVGDAEVVGKATGKDAAAGKATQVSLLGIDAARDLLESTVASADAELKPFGDRADVLKAATQFAAQRSS